MVKMMPDNEKETAGVSSGNDNSEVTEEQVTGELNAAPDEEQQPEAADAPSESEAAAEATEERQNSPAESETASAPAEPDCAPSDAIPADVPEVGEKYVWSFADEAKKTEKKRRAVSRRGALIYSAIMTAAFLVCFGLLIAIALTAPSGTDNSGAQTPEVQTQVIEKHIYIREDGQGTGKLTIAEIADKVKPSVVSIEVKKAAGEGVGTGIIKTSDGYILTNYHVVDNGTAITVIMPDGAKYTGEYIGGNELSDVAVLKINATGLVAAEFGNSDSLVVGETAVAIGTPGGLEYAGTVTSGIISATERNVKFYDSTGLLQKTMCLIQTSTVISPGNSGGPLVNGDGQVIGINTYKIMGTGYEGIGFAIPINGALAIFDDIMSGGSGNVGEISAPAARLGITGGAVKKGDSFTYQDQSGKYVTAEAGADGVAVTSIPDNSYDVASKLIPGDIIVGMEGYIISDIGSVREIVSQHKAGDTVQIRFYRNGSELTVSVTLGS